MSDQYDLYCSHLLEQTMQQMQQHLAATPDDVTCACANYLQSEGQISKEHPVFEQSEADVTHTIPTTTNVIQGETI